MSPLFLWLTASHARPKEGLIFPRFLLSRTSVTAPVEWSGHRGIASGPGSLLAMTNSEQSFAETKRSPKLGQTMKRYSKKKQEIRGTSHFPAASWFLKPFLCGTYHLMGSDSALAPHLSSTAVTTFLQDRYYLHQSNHTGERARNLPWTMYSVKIQFIQVSDSQLSTSINTCIRASVTTSHLRCSPASFTAFKWIQSVPKT